MALKWETGRADGRCTAYCSMPTHPEVMQNNGVWRAG